MTTSRMVGVLVALALVGIAVVAIRVDQSRATQRIQKLQFEHTDLKREIWTQEVEIARLRSPQAIREQASRLGLEVAPKPPAAVKPARR
ncbi:MAG TPA: FtsL-like putative cell division protein [Phycisphaerae bacterium]|jgi:cell division protein FtsL|nr:hypothetical protein [Phycisphaerae bacterium]HOB75416.1 FtsL-like putative cell division protein [Phycisphaerae bacterium]HOJ55651.1 FtsL-like putative cell division protein [Phycisphaerae bacterium]HOL27662.1 FtsL-like putative cell division protein [Phycisphaerae bacterium]HPP21964.1 FtsL-like putative cell division protein [Phycisphaerae bacterium]